MLITKSKKIIVWLCCLMVCSGAVCAQTIDIKLAFLSQAKEKQPALSNLDAVLTDEGIQGARLGVKDNNTTGQFTGHRYALRYIEAPATADVAVAFKQLVDEGYRYVLTDLRAATLSPIAQLAIEHKVLLFNVSASDDALRFASCNDSVFHTIPSYAMRADALAQFMLKKRWTKWFLINGSDHEDLAFSKALKRSAKRFGMSLVAEKTWAFQHDARRTAQAEIPVFTQGPEYDVVVVADIKGLFGEYLSMNSWLPRPIVGSQGAVPRAWHRTHERWGAAQMQNRFYKQAGRWMTDVDYAAWLAVRSLGEAVTRGQSIKTDDVRSFMRSDQFSLAGFKGTKLSFRPWSQQLRQPILLATDRSIVSVLPHKEFLHPHTYLDTLGYDRPESQCQK
jgi:ABC transporter substrate binding protein (PQQ-dependent alcohol dehydrogenase system)|tara:strand:- start:2038 stop:3213 length:1176 start_codon:yes stop_codon:yes gene_type:complete